MQIPSTPPPPFRNVDSVSVTGPGNLHFNHFPRWFHFGDPESILRTTVVLISHLVPVGLSVHGVVPKGLKISLLEQGFHLLCQTGEWPSFGRKSFIGRSWGLGGSTLHCWIPLQFEKVLTICFAFLVFVCFLFGGGKGLVELSSVIFWPS